MAAREYAFRAQLMYLDYLNNAAEQEFLPRSNDMLQLSEKKFLERYRLSKCVVRKVLEEIQERLEYPTERNLPLSPTQQFLIALRYYATGSFQIVMGDTAGVSKATVSRIVHRVSVAIAALRPLYISFPRVEEQREVMQGFFEGARFPGVLGALDCTHIPIQSPGHARGEIYRNRKGYFSLNIQTVCDSELLIRDIIVRWPGSVHDSTIFNNSRIRADFETRRVNGGVLLGDNGYPLRTYLLTPYLDPQTRAQERYNRAHKRTRNCVERMYGVWKRRFPVLSMGLRTKMQTTLKIIVATAVLHNIAIQTRDNIPPEDLRLHQYFNQRGHDGDNQDVGLHVGQEHGTAVAFRNAIAEQHFA